MKVYRSLEDFKPLPHAVVTQGTFDGVHLGHQKILKRLRVIADEEEGETVLLTFFPHPRMVLQPEDNTLRLLETVEEKIAHLEEEGIDHLLVVPFTKEFSRQSSEEFVRDVLVNRLGMKVLVIGYDHRFGKNREGSMENLRELAPLYDFRVEEIPAEDIEAMTISSTKIRNALLAGDLLSANTFLGYPYKVSGRVVDGNKRGRTIGFPTANIQVSEAYKQIPGDGVYAVRAVIGEKKYGAMANIGHQPTFANRKHAFEVNIFDFDEDIYNEVIHIEFMARIRSEIHFDSVGALINQLEKDKFAARAILQAG
jgi:riboflavin kinase/FMN adenylyltransferase